MKPNAKVVKWLSSAGFSLSLILAGGYLVAPWEGKVNAVYKDPVGILTSCYGHTGKELKMGQVFTDEECLQQLSEDLKKAKAGVDRQITVPLTPYQEAALISFVYNAGEGNLSKSTLRAKFNSKDYHGGCRELTRWVYAKGIKLKGLENRRRDELAVCLGTEDVTSYIEFVIGASKNAYPR